MLPAKHYFNHQHQQGLPKLLTYFHGDAGMMLVTGTLAAWQCGMGSFVVQPQPFPC